MVTTILLQLDSNESILNLPKSTQVSFPNSLLMPFLELGVLQLWFCRRTTPCTTNQKYEQEINSKGIKRNGEVCVCVCLPACESAELLCTLVIRFLLHKFQDVHCTVKVATGETHADRCLMFISRQHPHFNSSQSQSLNRLLDLLLQPAREHTHSVTKIEWYHTIQDCAVYGGISFPDVCVR